MVLTGSAAPPDMRFWVRLFKMADHYLSRLDERLSKRQAQTHRAAAAIVRRTNTGSVASCGPSSQVRQMCASVINQKPCRRL